MQMRDLIPEISTNNNYKWLGEREKTVQLKDRTGEEEAPRVYSGQVSQF
jgi:hypothetical protein